MVRGNGTRWFFSYLPQGMAGGATSPLIPLFAYALGGNLAHVGIIAAATSIASVPAFVLWGWMSDRLQRRKAFLLLGFLGTALSLALMALSSHLAEFYVANLIIGFLGAAGAPVGAVLVMETARREEWPKKLALLSQMAGVGWILGLSLGAVWLTIGPSFVGGMNAMRGLFVIGAALALASALLAGLWLQEPVEHVDRRFISLADTHFLVERVKFLPARLLHYLDPRNHHGGGLLSRPLRLYLVSVFLLFSGFTAFYGFFPILLRQLYGFSDPEIFAVYIASQLASVVAYVRVGEWVRDRGGRVTQIYASLGRTALFPSFLVVALFPAPPMRILAVVLLLHAGVGLCWAIINVSGSTLASRLAPERGRAEALGAYNAMQGFGAILGPLVGGFVAEFAGYGPAIGGSVLFILAGVALLALNRAAEG